MRILLTADPEVPVPPTGYGGIERIVDALVRHFRQQGHEVCLVAKAGSRSPASTVVAWPGERSRSKLGTWRNALALRRAAREFRADVVHSFSRLAYLTPLLPSPVAKVMSYQRHTGGRQITWATRLSGGTLRFTGCSEFIAQMGKATAGDWTAIPNFVEPERITFVPHVPPEAPLLFLSRIESIKGPDLAIAIARASGRRLLLAGNHATEGPERDFWDQAIVPHLGRDGIEYVGEVDDSAKNTLLGRAAALVVPIQWDEPFGIVFAEALAAGTPVITCARGATPEIVEDGVTGYFVRTIADGAAAVARIPQIDRARCRRTAEQHFSLEVCATRYLQVYESCLASLR